MRALLWPCLVLFPLTTCVCPVLPYPDSVPDSVVGWSRIAVGTDGAQQRARGFDGALPAGAVIEILLEEGGVLASGIADERGRFDLVFDGPTEVLLEVSEGGLTAPEQLRFTVREIEQSRTAAINPRFAQTGAVPNQLALPAAFAGSDALLLVVNSGDNSVDNLSLTSAARLAAPLFLPERDSMWGPLAAQPFALADHGTFATVSRLGQSGLTVFDIGSGAIVAEHDETGIFDLPAAFEPAVPVDGNGDGVPEDVVDRLWPRTFEGLAFASGRIFLCAANLLHTGSPVVYGPGMVLIYDFTGSALVPAATPVVLTRFANPQIAVAEGGRVAVVETGALESSGGGWFAASHGGIEVIDAATLQVVTRTDLGLVAPGTAAFGPDGSHLYVGSLLRPELYKISLATGDVVRGPDAPIQLFASSQVQSVFSMVGHPMGLLFATSFNSDEVYVVDTIDDTVSPWPFDQPFKLAEGLAMSGAHSLVLRPGRNGVDFRGPDLAILLSLAARIATIDTRHLMGP